MPLDSKALPVTGGRPPTWPPAVYHGRTQPTRMTTAGDGGKPPPAAKGIAIHRTSDRRLRGLVDAGTQDAHVPKVTVELAVIEAVAHDELVRDREPDVVDGDVHEPAGRLVEQRADPERPRVLAAQVPEQVVERQARVDDVLDEQDVAAVDARR